MSTDRWPRAGNGRGVAGVAPGPGASTAAAMAVLVTLMVGVAAYLLSFGDRSAIEADPVPVPGVIGLSEREALDQVHAAGLEAEVVHLDNVRYPPGTVFGQDPRGGVRAAPGTVVRIEVSLGDDAVLVPMVLGSPAGDAERRLRLDHGLEVLAIPESRCDVAEGEVFGQDPLWRRVRRGSIVQLRFARPERVEVPDVAGGSFGDAAAALVERGFTALESRRASQWTPVGRVIRTEPAAGTEQEVCAPVTVLVSTGAPPAWVPEVVGRTRQEAEVALGRAGLVPVVRYVDLPAGHEHDGRVLEQSPGPARVTRGATVHLLVGRAALAGTTTTVPSPTSSSTVPPTTSDPPGPPTTTTTATTTTTSTTTTTTTTAVPASTTTEPADGSGAGGSGGPTGAEGP